MADTRPQPSAEPVAWMYTDSEGEASLHGCRLDNTAKLGWTETPLYPASALEAARREDQARIAELEACIDLVIPDDCKSQLHEDATNMLKLQVRIEAREVEGLRAEVARLRGHLSNINRKASPDPERTMSEASNDLYWCACEARAALEGKGGSHDQP